MQALARNGVCTVPQRFWDREFSNAQLPLHVTVLFEVEGVLDNVRSEGTIARSEDNSLRLSGLWGCYPDHLVFAWTKVNENCIKLQLKPPDSADDQEEEDDAARRPTKRPAPSGLLEPQGKVRAGPDGARRQEPWDLPRNNLPPASKPLPEWTQRTQPMMNTAEVLSLAGTPVVRSDRRGMRRQVAARGCAKLVRTTTRLYIGVGQVREWLGEVGSKTELYVKVMLDDKLLPNSHPADLLYNKGAHYYWITSRTLKRTAMGKWFLGWNHTMEDGLVLLLRTPSKEEIIAAIAEGFQAQEDEAAAVAGVPPPRISSVSMRGSAGSDMPYDDDANGTSGESGGNNGGGGGHARSGSLGGQLGSEHELLEQQRSYGSNMLGAPRSVAAATALARTRSPAEQQRRQAVMSLNTGIVERPPLDGPSGATQLLRAAAQVGGPLPRAVAAAPTVSGSSRQPSLALGRIRSSTIGTDGTGNSSSLTHYEPGAASGDTVGGPYNSSPVQQQGGLHTPGGAGERPGGAGQLSSGYGQGGGMLGSASSTMQPLHLPPAVSSLLPSELLPAAVSVRCTLDGQLHSKVYHCEIHRGPRNTCLLYSFPLDVLDGKVQKDWMVSDDGCLVLCLATAPPMLGEAPTDRAARPAAQGVSASAAAAQLLAASPATAALAAAHRSDAAARLLGHTPRQLSNAQPGAGGSAGAGGGGAAGPHSPSGTGGGSGGSGGAGGAYAAQQQHQHADSRPPSSATLAASLPDAMDDDAGDAAALIIPRMALDQVYGKSFTLPMPVLLRLRIDGAIQPQVHLVEALGNEGESVVLQGVPSEAFNGRISGWQRLTHNSHRILLLNMLGGSQPSVSDPQSKQTLSVDFPGRTFQGGAGEDHGASQLSDPAAAKAGATRQAQQQNTSQQQQRSHSSGEQRPPPVELSPKQELQQQQLQLQLPTRLSTGGEYEPPLSLKVPGKDQLDASPAAGNQGRLSQSGAAGGGCVACPASLPMLESAFAEGPPLSPLASPDPPPSRGGKPTGAHGQRDVFGRAGSPNGGGGGWLPDQRSLQTALNLNALGNPPKTLQPLLSSASNCLIPAASMQQVPSLAVVDSSKTAVENSTLPLHTSGSFALSVMRHHNSVLPNVNSTAGGLLATNQSRITIDGPGSALQQQASMTSAPPGAVSGRPGSNAGGAAYTLSATPASLAMPGIPLQLTSHSNLLAPRLSLPGDKALGGGGIGGGSLGSLEAQGSVTMPSQQLLLQQHQQRLQLISQLGNSQGANRPMALQQEQQRQQLLAKQQLHLAQQQHQQQQLQAQLQQQERRLQQQQQQQPLLQSQQQMSQQQLQHLREALRSTQGPEGGQGAPEERAPQRQLLREISARDMVLSTRLSVQTANDSLSLSLAREATLSASEGLPDPLHLQQQQLQPSAAPPPAPLQPQDGDMYDEEEEQQQQQQQAPGQGAGAGNGHGAGAAPQQDGSLAAEEGAIAPLGSYGAGSLTFSSLSGLSSLGTPPFLKGLSICTDGDASTGRLRDSELFRLGGAAEPSAERVGAEAQLELADDEQLAGAAADAVIVDAGTLMHDGGGGVISGAAAADGMVSIPDALHGGGDAAAAANGDSIFLKASPDMELDAQPSQGMQQLDGAGMEVEQDMPEQPMELQQLFPHTDNIKLDKDVGALGF